MCSRIHKCPRVKTKKSSQLKTNFLSVHGAYASICDDNSMDREMNDLVEDKHLSPKQKIWSFRESNLAGAF